MPQIAAFADNHIHIEKRSADGRTATVLSILDYNARLQELVRMTAGDSTSLAAYESAAELLQSAQAVKINYSRISTGRCKNAEKFHEKELDEIYVPGSNEEVFSGRLLKVQRDHVTLPNGEDTTREYIRHPGAVAIVPVLADGKVVLVKQCRYPINTLLWEFLPAN